MARSGSKWLNNIWYGKSAVVGCNAMLLPFVLPLIVWIVLSQCFSALLSGITGTVGGAVVLTVLGLLPCGLIYSVGLAGAVFCTKNALVDGNMDIKHRFAQGIRKNAPRYLLFTFLMWLSMGFAVITPTLYAYMGISILYGIGLVVAVFQFAVIGPVMCLAMIQCAFYDDPLKYNFTNAFKLYFMRPFRMIGVTILSSLPFVFCLLFPFGWQMAFWVIYSVVGVSVGIVFALWYCKRYFDKVTCGCENDVVAFCKDDPVDDTAEQSEIQDVVTGNQRSVSV